MILLGFILLVVGLFTIRPLVWVGGALILIGLVLWLAAVPGPRIRPLLLTFAEPGLKTLPPVSTG
jgi:hypothetical protein